MLRRGLKTAYYHSLMRIDHYLRMLTNGKVSIRFGVGSFARSVWLRSAWTGQLLSEARCRGGYLLAKDSKETFVFYSLEVSSISKVLSEKFIVNQGFPPKLRCKNFFLFFFFCFGDHHCFVGLKYTDMFKKIGVSAQKLLVVTFFGDQHYLSGLKSSS